MKYEAQLLILGGVDVDASDAGCTAIPQRATSAEVTGHPRS